jgi:hypothetical protein
MTNHAAPFVPHARAAWRKPAALSVLLSALLLAGCSVPKPVKTYACVTSYERMTDRHDPLVSLVYVDDHLALSMARGVVVGGVDINAQWVRKADVEVAEAYARYLRAALLLDLARLRQFDFVLPDRGGPNPDDDVAHVLRLETQVTRFDMGSGWKRYFSPFIFMAAGATDLQLEGRVVDLGTGRVVLEFADRRRHMGNTAWGPNPQNLKDEGFAMKHTARQTANGLACLLGAVCKRQPAAMSEIAAGD